MTAQDANGLDASTLHPYQPRTFVPGDADLTDKDQVVALCRALLDRPVESAADTDQLVLDNSELGAAVDQAGSVLYIRMTCQTDDPARAETYKSYVQTIPPAVKPLDDQWNRKYLQARYRFGGDAARYEVFDRGLRADVELFREANVPLQTELSLLSQEYQTVTGAMMVEFQGAERTLPEMGKFLHEPDRPLREAAWRATAQRRLVDRNTLDELFGKMLDLRRKVAANADCPSYTEFRFRELHRFDYTPADCKAYHDAVERCVLPVWQGILQRRQETMGVDTLRPWDTAVDPRGRAPLKPFETAPELIARTREVFTRTDPELGEQFAMMDQLGLLDLASRKGKAPGGYQATLAEARKPFIFMNAVGLDQDVRTLLHEGGHAFHALAADDEPIHAYRHAPMEFCEVASMAMELLAGEHLGVFYGDEALRRSKREHLETVVWILPWVATIDAFQHWLYGNPGHTADARRAAWLDVRDRFSGGVIDWTGLDEERSYLWHRQLHLFEVPFYYIEYAIAQLGALQLWVKAKADPAAALAGYKRALALGGSRPLPELFAAAGLTFDFSADTIAPLMDAVAKELETI